MDKTIQKHYKAPRIDIVILSSADIITESGGDENQGEWDPQPTANNGIYSVEENN